MSAGILSTLKLIAPRNERSNVYTTYRCIAI
jgi:hypothetical protein